MPGQYWAASPWTASIPLIIREGPQMKDGHPSSAIYNICVKSCLYPIGTKTDPVSTSGEGGVIVSSNVRLISGMEEQMY